MDPTVKPWGVANFESLLQLLADLESRRNNHPAKFRPRIRRAPFMIPRKKSWWITTHHFSDGRIIPSRPDMERRKACRFLSVRAAARRAKDSRNGETFVLAGRRGRAFWRLNAWRVKPSGGRHYGRSRRRRQRRDRGA